MMFNTNANADVTCKQGFTYPGGCNCSYIKGNVTVHDDSSEFDSPGCGFYQWIDDRVDCEHVHMCPGASGYVTSTQASVICNTKHDAISRVVYSAVRAARMVVGSSPEPPPMPVDTSAGMWIKKARLPC